ncbi:HAMP domain-containing histidine kinase [Patescibacteria group bacterium]|nr:HAMP domain-containing histidine kinase [Patescibacteria group bacterium]
MFHSARLKLTAWYLLIIMLITVSFSVAMYRVSTSELDRIEQTLRSRSERRIILRPGTPTPLYIIDPDILEETRRRLIAVLAIIDLGILVISAGAGYFLAGRTLGPIKEMVDEQNRFITDASHELRTPLTSLKTATEVYLRDKQPKIADTRELIASNLEEINRLQYLSDNLIKLTQYGKTENGITFEPVRLAKIIDEAVSKVAALSKAKKITIDNRTADYRLEGNAASLCELFVILLDNAIKYSPEHSKISLTSKGNNQSVTIEVADQGMGIDPSDLPHIFDRFYRADKSRHITQTAGYGLGLSIAAQIIKKHNGSIQAQSWPGDGSVFFVNLPRTQSSRLI